MQKSYSTPSRYPIVVNRRHGQLIITAAHLELKLSGLYANRSRKVMRSALVGIPTLLGVAGFMGLGGKPNLQFDCMGNVTILAEWLKKEGACRSCQKPLQAGAEFCLHCGKKVTEALKACPVCATVTIEDAQWCPSCGSAF